MGKKRQQQQRNRNANGVQTKPLPQKSSPTRARPARLHGSEDGEFEEDERQAPDALAAAALAATSELLATAKELYRSLGGGTDDGVDGEGEGGEDAYWRGLPASVRAGVREAAAVLTEAGLGGDDSDDGESDVDAVDDGDEVSGAGRGMPRIESPRSVVGADQYFSPSSSPSLRSGKEAAGTNDSNRPAKAASTMAPPPPPPPSSVSIGKKPMAYQQNQQAAPPARSARAAGKAAASSYPSTANNSSPSVAAGAAADKGRGKGGGGAGNNSKIWSTSSSEERERIRDFWLGLGEEERRDLVRVEKDTVLRKMKEQQKHSCSCAVCGRKRNAIEEELQVLYDAYYEDLEQYALYQQQYLSSNRTLPPPPGPGPFPGSVEVDRYGAVVGYSPHTAHQPNANANNHRPRKANGKGGRRRRAQAQRAKRRPPPAAEEEEEDEEEDVYEEEEEEEEEDGLSDGEDADGEGEDDPPLSVPATPQMPNGGMRGRGGVPARGGRGGVAAGGGGRGAVDMKGKITAGVGAGVGGPTSILTVADDLLKNDGQKFLEMMEQLAERRMAREEEAAEGVSGDEDDDSSGSLDGDASDGSDGEDASDEDDGEDDGEGDSADEDDDPDGDEDDEEGSDSGGEEVMTEEQKMEEGKRMFSIFAARMFEQRVFKAYRESVAQERQLQLLREIEDEGEREREKEAKKQTQNQKKKAKRLQQKQAKEEKEAQKAAEKAAEEAAAKAKQAALEEEQRKRREEERLKREAARKAQEEEKARKEEERKKRLAEEKEREAERERKRREKEERTKAERREREERERKAKEEREAKAAKERAAQLAAAKEREEKERERKKALKEKEEKEAKEKAEKLLAAQQQQQRAAAAAKNTNNNGARSAAVVSPTSPRNANAGVNSNATASGSNQRAIPPMANGSGSQPKKILNKMTTPVAPAVPVAVSPTSAQQITSPSARHVTPQQQPRPAPALHALSMSHSQPQTPLTPQMQHMPPASMFPQPISPRSAYAVQPPYSFAPGPSSVQLAQQQQGIPPTPRGYTPTSASMNSGGFDPSASTSSFHRGLPTSTSLPLSPTPAPIGPPPKLPPGRRASLMGDPGPITRPAPIARPAHNNSTDNGSGSGSASPARRSPSPKGVLGSAALLADDDEVVPVRRPGAGPGAVGQNWGAPGRGAPATHWGAPGAAAPGYNNAIGAGRGQTLWGGGPEWHPTAMQGFYPRGAYIGNPAAASPPSHSGGS